MTKLKCLGMTLTHQNCIWKEIKSRLNSGNAYYYSVQDLFSSFLLCENCMGVKLISHTNGRTQIECI